MSEIFQVGFRWYRDILIDCFSKVRTNTWDNKSFTQQTAWFVMISNGGWKKQEHSKWLNSYGSNHLLGMVMEPKYLAEEVIPQSWEGIPTEWETYNLKAIFGFWMMGFLLFSQLLMPLEHALRTSPKSSFSTSILLCTDGPLQVIKGFTTPKI